MPASPRTAYLLFDVAGRVAALPRDAVREILPLPHLHAPPAADGPLAGFLNLSGAPVPVLDLPSLLGMRDVAGFDAYRHIVLSADGSIGLLVDRAVDLLVVEPDAVQPVEDARTFNGCVEAEIAHGDRLIHVLTIERLLTAEEKLRLDAMTQRAGDRLAAFDSA